VFLGVLAARGPGVPGASNGGRPRQFAPFASLSRGTVLAGGAALLCLFAVSALLPWLSKDLASDALAQASSGKPADLREAAKKAETASRLNPFSVQPLFAAASVAQRSGQPAKAGKLFVEAIERQPDNAITWFRLAGFQVLLADSPAALKSIAKARSLDPQNALLAFVQLSAVFDERRTATSTGTPLPEKVDENGFPIAAQPKKPKKPKAGPAAPSPGAAPTTSAPQVPTAPAPSAPAPTAPRAPAAPKAPAKKAPAGQPFRFEG
jgi:tetratricopeptide (TPR) repeat protein